MEKYRNCCSVFFHRLRNKGQKSSRPSWFSWNGYARKEKGHSHYNLSLIHIWLSPMSLAVTVRGVNIADFCEKSVSQALDFINHLELSPRDSMIACLLYTSELLIWMSTQSLLPCYIVYVLYIHYNTEPALSIDLCDFSFFQQEWIKYFPKSVFWYIIRT